MTKSPEQLELSMVPSMHTFLRYRDLPYEAWYAIAEFVDNSTQNYLENRDHLPSELPVRIHYDAKERSIDIYDEAMGMDESDLLRAVVPGARPPNTKGRCEYGLGMKTSCCWMGRRWTVITKKKGVPFEFRLEIDVEQLAESDGRVVATRKAAKTDLHYTRITIHDMYQVFRTKTLNKIKTFLAEIYRFDIEEGWLRLEWNGEPLRFDGPALFRERLPDGKEREWKQPFELQFDDRKVKGWVGILHPGDLARSGFNCYRRNRLIKARWKVPELFPPKPGHLLHQRLTGELFLDDFDVTHTKDDFKWDDADPEEFGERLMQLPEVKSVRDKAVGTKFKDVATTNATIDLARDQLAPEMESAALVNQLSIAEASISLPEKQTPQEHTAYLDKLKGPVYKPIAWTIKYRGETKATAYFPKDMSPNDPYLDFMSTPKGDRVDIFININHPFAKALEEKDQEAFLTYVKMLIFEALAIWLAKCQGKETPSAREVSRAKDQLLRTEEVLQIDEVG